MVRKVAPVELAMWRMGLSWPLVPWMERLPHGLLVPTPTSPLPFQTPEFAKYALPETVSAVVDAYGKMLARVVLVATT